MKLFHSTQQLELDPTILEFLKRITMVELSIQKK